MTIDVKSVQRTVVGHGLAHDSAAKQIAGEASYIDDMVELPGTLHAALVVSPVAHGRLKGVDPARALAMPGVVAFVAAGDIPGDNDIGPILSGEPLFAEDVVDYAGMPIGAIAATTYEQAVKAAREVALDIEELEPVLDVETAHARGSYVMAPQILLEGDIDAALAEAERVIEGRLEIGGQDHFYLETHIAYAVPGEDGDMVIHSSTQHPTEVQHHVAHVLGGLANSVDVFTRRMGGGFGGKESQPTIIASAAALLARKAGKPVKMRLKRSTDMSATGKRHDMVASWKVGVDADGRIRGLDIEYLARAGNTPDLTGPVITRTLTHSDNSYFVPAARLVGHACKTNTVSNTAFRGFGGPQGIIGIEAIMDQIARELQLDPTAVRMRNYYGPETGEVTPYGQPVETSQNRLTWVTESLLGSSEWERRRAEIDAHNAADPLLRRGLAFMPVKFGISFNLTSLNQAGALVHVYQDGSVHLNHGGTEMGQGLFMKVAQVVAEVFQIGIDQVKITATTTGKVPNTSATAASTGSDLNGMAAYNAATAIRGRMANVAAGHFDVAAEEIVFREERVHAGNRSVSFGELAKLTWAARVQLSEAGYYATPKIHWDPKTLKGRPFFYYTYGAAVAEVAVDTLTGESRCLRADLLQDCGASLNPAIDLGQIEGAFVQGMGWLTCEELWWDDKGRLRTVGPSTYKIPGSRDVPPEFNVALLDNAANGEETVYRSKAVGEPPLMLAVAVWLAIRDAVASCGAAGLSPNLKAPATPENILAAIDDMRARSGAAT
ncbi:xanthine dehydrogenase molybdopterin binding subunit [Oricola sp.]|uniref:xanthine dehydrogenase molybdopterin binding subunit n=1 Tax=Oricola sp. TaxID=1979950 RepID=UPI0025EE02B6|nr:xanthine dehydrogenase molybdopterin binding subunit [Oricola sp.]MCI5073641.1 xanthine dehydrogenase molybdopterin binding subunit [Oricola sp.]